jgi:uncharacterized membrane protein YraQ (UPF0718 family)
MDWKKQWKSLVAMVAVFAVLFWLPVGWGRFRSAVFEGLHLARWYAREHVVLCLLPAFFIAGGIAVFVQKESVMKYLGAKAHKAVAYGVASVSGTILAVCSCTVLPLFAGIYRMGAGIGPATAFLYSGPAINVLAIILTATVLGPELGIARAVGAVVFSIVIGLAMHRIYRKEEAEKAAGQMAMPEPEVNRPLWQNALLFALMIGVLVFANWGGDGLLAAWKWWIAGAFAAGLACAVALWFGVKWWKMALAAVVPVGWAILGPTDGLWVLLPFAAGVVGLAVALATDGREGREWFSETWSFARQILPLLLGGVLVAGFLLGRPTHQGLIPGRYVEMLLGETPETFFEVTGWRGGTIESVVRVGWPLWTNLFASLFGALMYFATLTEVPILQGLIASGMAKGPALALLLAGPALSLPNMLVIASVLGVRKTITFVMLVVAGATVSGMAYGALF